jgi:hypothetical protein
LLFQLVELSFYQLPDPYIQLYIFLRILTIMVKNHYAVDSAILLSNNRPPVVQRSTCTSFQ